MALGLAGSGVVCVLLATQVSATVPAEEARRLAEVAMPVCTPTLLDLARERAAGHMRALAIVEELEPADDYVSGLALIERSKRQAAHKAFIAGERDLSLRTLAMCGQPTQLNLCFGFTPPTAASLSRYYWDDYMPESEEAWRSRVARARREALLCPGLRAPVVEVPDARDVDCGDVTYVRAELASTARQQILRRYATTWDDPVFETLRHYERAGGYRNLDAYDLDPESARLLEACGVSTTIDVCVGFRRDDMTFDPQLVSDYRSATTEKERLERERQEAELCR